MRFRLAPILLSLLAAAVLAGCGGGEDGPEADERPAATSQAARGDPANGKSLFAEHGCAACHTFAAANATGSVGPNLDERLKADAKGAEKPLEAFVRESIVDPNAFVAPGFKPGVMPQDFGERLSGDEVADSSPS